MIQLGPLNTLHSQAANIVNIDYNSKNLDPYWGARNHVKKTSWLWLA